MMSHRRNSRPLVTCRSLSLGSALLLAWSTGCGSVDFESSDDTSEIVPPPTSTATDSMPGGNDVSEGSLPPSNVPPVTPPTPTPSTPSMTSSNGGSSQVPPTSSSPTATEANSWDDVTSEGGDFTSDSTEGFGTSSDGTSAPTTPPTTPPTGDEVPMTDHCAAVADWDPAWTQWEDEVLLLVNEYRAAGANCDSQGQFAATQPLAMDAILRCSSRLHSLDMFERDYFDHTNPDGEDPFDRMEDAGFSGSYMGENIAWGQSSPTAVMEAWIDSDGHCANVMNPNFTLLGVGYYPGSDNWRDGQHFWTQNLGAPRRQGGRGDR